MTPDQLAKTGSEDGEQMALFAWAAMAARYGFAVAWDNTAYASKEAAERLFIELQKDMGIVDHPCQCARLDSMFAIPNGGLRHKATAGRLKATGVKSGVPDIMLPVSVGNWHGLFVEMKKVVGGTVSHEQKDWIRKLTCNKYRVYVCRGWAEAAQAIQYYLEGKDTYASTGP